jgi:hypothetical protein
MTRTRDVATQGGLVLLNTTTFSAQTSVSFNNLFTSNYLNYKVTININASSTGTLQLRYRTSGSDKTSALYYSSGYQLNRAGTGVSRGADTTTSISLGQISGDIPTIPKFNLEIFSPEKSSEVTGLIHTSLNQDNSQTYWISQSSLFYALETHDGFTIYPSTGTLSGTVKIYGYK